jgi:hypothetical protein
MMSLKRFLTIVLLGFAVAWWFGIIELDDIARLLDQVGFFDLLERM